MSTALRIWLLAAALGFSWLPPQTGGIAGKISDEGGGLLPGVTVMMKSEGRTRITATNAQGEYRIDGLQPGQYRIEVSLPGFAPVSAENVVIDADKTATWNATLKVAGRYGFNPFADFQARVKQIVGPDAVDCGQHRLLKPFTPAPVSELNKSLACGLEAAGQNKAFWMSFQLQGIDSTIFYGVAGTTNGTMYRLSYDSDPSGGSGSTPRFSAQPCAKPSLSSDRGDIVIVRCS